MTNLPTLPDRSPCAELPKSEVRDYLSFSAVSTFQSCPLRYYFRYVRGLPEETIASSLVFGAAIHSAIQAHFEQIMVGTGPPDLDYLVGVFQDAWKDKATIPVQYGKREDFDSLCQLADRTLWTFLETDWAYPKGQIVGIEEELRGSIIPGCPDVLGRLDLLVDAGEAMELTDFKTSRSDWSEGKAEDSAPQLLLYSELAQPLTDGKPLRLQFAVMTKTKSPSFTLHSVESNPDQVNRTKRIVQRVWKAIQGQHFYPNPSPINCGTCSYRTSCRAWTG